MDEANSTDNLINESAVQYQPPPTNGKKSLRSAHWHRCTKMQTHIFLQSLENSKNVCRSAVGFQSTRWWSKVWKSSLLLMFNFAFSSRVEWALMMSHLFSYVWVKVTMSNTRASRWGSINSLSSKPEATLPPHSLVYIPPHTHTYTLPPSS